MPCTLWRMEGSRPSDSGTAVPPRAWGGLAAIATGFLLVVWLSGWLGGAGYFIDEFYFLACSEHLAWGYVDHPPLSILLLRGIRAVLGDSLPALRAVPALAAAATVLLTGDLARRLGAAAWGQCLAGTAVAAAPVFQILFGFYSMNALSVVLWTVCFRLLVEIALRDEPRLWLAVGLVVGVGLENKHTIALLAAGLAVGLAATPARRHLSSRYFWGGVGVALVCAAPNLAWQWTHDFASLEFYRNQDLTKNRPTPAWDVLWQQALALNPLSLPVWLAGLALLLRSGGERGLRHLGVAYLVLLGLLVLGGKSRPDRIAAVYPLLFAAGAARLDRALPRGFGRALALPLLAAGGLALAPLALPLLPPEATARYSEALGVVPQIEAGPGKRSALPQWLADRYGWPELLADVEAAAAALGPEERRAAIVLGASYGQAAPVEILGRGRGLPPVYSPHNAYHTWGPPPDSLRTAIAVGFGREDAAGEILPDPALAALFARVELVGVHRCRWCMGWRNGMPIWIARGPLRPPSEVWAAGRRYQ